MNFCETCDYCKGEGIIGRRVRVYEHGCGFARDDTEESPCPKCHGEGVQEYVVECSEGQKWRVKDYADGWIYCETEDEARGSDEAKNGALVEPLLE